MVSILFSMGQWSVSVRRCCVRVGRSWTRARAWLMVWREGIAARGHQAQHRNAGPSWLSVMPPPAQGRWWAKRSGDGVLAVNRGLHRHRGRWWAGLAACMFADGAEVVGAEGAGVKTVLVDSAHSLSVGQVVQVSQAHLERRFRRGATERQVHMIAENA